MAGIVTTSSNTGSVRTYKAVFTSTTTSLAINWISGTTSAAAVPYNVQDKGVAVSFQNLSTAATITVTVGGSDVGVNTQGIVLGARSATDPATYQPYPATNSTVAIQLSEWWICSTSSLAVIVAQLIRAC